MDILLLYLFTRLDPLHSLLGGVMAACFIVASISGVCWFFANLDDKDAPKPRATIKWCFIVFFSVGALGVVIPTQKALALIVGGKLAVDGLQSDTAKKVYAIVQDMLDDELAKIAKKREPK